MMLAGAGILGHQVGHPRLEQGPLCGAVFTTWSGMHTTACGSNLAAALESGTGYCQSTLSGGVHHCKVGLLVLMQALKEENIKVLTVNPAQTSTHMTWDRPDSEYIPDKMIQVCGPDTLLVLASAVSLNKCIFTCSYLEDLYDAAGYEEAARGVEG